MYQINKIHRFAYFFDHLRNFRNNEDLTGEKIVRRQNPENNLLEFNEIKLTYLYCSKPNVLYLII